jgi:hypothetical protein
MNFPSTRSLIAILAAFSLVYPSSALAFLIQLSESDVREAYFLGKDRDRSADFLKQYSQSLSVPETGPQIAQVELRTPYAQIVATTHDHITGYSAQQAAADYQSRGDTFLVHVQVLFTPAFTNRPADFWHAVSVGLVQKDHHAATAVTGQPIWANVQPNQSSWVIGADVYCTFPAAGITADPVDVEVIPPEGPAVRVTFDLTSLK